MLLFHRHSRVYFYFVLRFYTDLSDGSFNVYHNRQYIPWQESSIRSEALCGPFAFKVVV